MKNKIARRKIKLFKNQDKFKSFKKIKTRKMAVSPREAISCASIRAACNRKSCSLNTYRKTFLMCDAESAPIRSVVSNNTGWRVNTARPPPRTGSPTDNRLHGWLTSCWGPGPKKRQGLACRRKWACWPACLAPTDSDSASRLTRMLQCHVGVLHSDEVSGYWIGHRGDATGCQVDT